MSPAIPIYEITTSAARVCHALPLDNGGIVASIVDFLSGWQSLAGAFIGATVSLFVALIVADRVPRRERRAVAMAALFEIRSILVVERELSADTSEERWQSLREFPLPGRVLCGEDLSRLQYVHSSLTAHLLFLRECHRRLSDDLIKYHTLKKDVPRRDTKVDERVQRRLRLADMESRLDQYLRAIARNAESVEYYLGSLVLCSRLSAAYSRVRMAVSSNAFDRRSKQVLADPAGEGEAAEEQAA